jgi:hypothetical protein
MINVDVMAIYRNYIFSEMVAIFVGKWAHQKVLKEDHPRILHVKYNYISITGS